ncbi:SDR family oxidoreductase [Providencia sneebia]|uniref:Putative NAD(P)-binding oxidoreductase n=1 Tax=Providencia sneebia DSM 19967 TaxID=1141660 RepID=K8VZE1_9GAMM|nr:SDR family oxidoreductase [Providencia sneebia]EKT53653.1 putative NAD(P)-binding oxidoreductase [Providencia sneebia DSM 19967]
MKRVLVTGGSRGIGRATALQLAGLGMQVFVNYKCNQQAANEVVTNIIESGGNAIAIQCDIAHENEVVKMFATIREKYGELHYLVNNAGILFHKCTAEQLTAERINAVMATNVTGLLICCREFIKNRQNLAATQDAVIVNISSISARFGMPGENVDYAASKGAVDTITKGLSTELAELGIRVNSVRPGVIYTDIHSDAGEPERVDRIASNIPMKRGGKPEEIAEVVTWLLSDASSYMTGSIIEVGGGR